MIDLDIAAPMFQLHLGLDLHFIDYCAKSYIFKNSSATETRACRLFDVFSILAALSYRCRRPYFFFG